MNSKEEPSTILYRFVKKKKKSINKEDLAFQLCSHPDYPQPISVLETLEKLKIKCSVYQTSLQEIDTDIGCFLTLLSNKQGNQFYSIVEKTKSGYKSDFKRIDYHQLHGMWTSIIIVIENNQEHNVERKNWFFKLLLLTIGVSTFFWATSYSFNFHTIIFSFLSIIGFILSLSVFDDLRIGNISVVSQLCERNKKTNCNEVINSTKWKLLKFLNFSDLSLTFFATQILVLYLMSLMTLKVEYFKVQNVLLIASIPFIFISIFYQKKVEKKWCPICLGISLILFLEFFINLPFVNYNYDFRALVFYFSIYGLVYVFWKKNRTNLLKKTELLSKLSKANQTLNNYETFKHILTKNNDKLECLISNSDSYPTIIVVTDPFCDHCKSLHSELAGLFGQTDTCPNISFVFNTDIEEESDFEKSIYRNLMFHQKNEGDTIFFMDVLEEWFFEKNKSQWLDKYSRSFDEKKIDLILKEQYNCCKNYNIKFTPAIIINGYLLPSTYTIQNLSFFIKHLVNDSNY